MARIPWTLPRRLALVALVTFATMLLTHCSLTTQETTIMLKDRPSLEEILVQYEAMHEDIFTSLEAELGPREWAPVSLHNRAYCEEDEAGERAFMRIQGFDGVYDTADWQRSVEIVTEVARQHGFTEVRTIIDRPDNIEITGQDQYGGTFLYAMAVNTMFSIDTGCHLP